MKVRLAVLSFLISLSGLATAETPSIVQTLQKQPQWGLVQPGISCIEKYQFLPSGDVLIKSDQQRVSGRYNFIPSQNTFDLPAVMISFETDNHKPDCAGNSQNQAGTSTTNFIKKESNQKIYFCLDALGKNCPVYLRPEH